MDGFDSTSSRAYTRNFEIDQASQDVSAAKKDIDRGVPLFIDPEF
jgi:hypothetical protein